MERETIESKSKALGHVGYELQMLALAAKFRWQVQGALPPEVNDLLLEALLLHARSMAEFLVLTRGRETDIRRTDFAEQWTPAPADAVERVREHVTLIDQHLAHLTRERVENPSPGWTYGAIAADLVDIAGEWSEHLRRHAPDLEAVFRPYVNEARQALAAIRWRSG